ncbi:IDE [Symbiodinium natans]|uniref:IDE protein n=1 Tax=Symbiodinium natans TaxID=878477 RepID=A0A812JMW6_9DINO|nr:IDE [Symbiodinium natans]
MCETTCDRARKGDLRKKGGSRTLLQTTWLHHHVGFLAAVSHQDYSFVELDNKLKAIIGSDPECDKAGAALCVNVGMCHERKDLPGLAHFLEHMLFTGTTKYPKEGEYHEFMNQNGGMANAFTLCYFTCYMFEVKPECLEEALDRFSRFFTEPLLTRDCTEREINAVDSEFQAGKTSPWWRYVGIMNMSANPDHPFHVAVGNNKVLLDEPKERGIDLYEEMKKLYESTYSANGMTLCVFGKQPPGELHKMVAEKFGPIVNKGLTMPIGDSVSDKPAFLPSEWHQQLLQNPVQDVKDLTFVWVIPFQDPLWRSKPSLYISHLLGHEGEGSVIAKLKQQGLISGCGVGDGNWLEGAFSLLKVNFDLTDKGLDSVQEIGQHLFAYLGLLQKMPPEKWIFDEMQKLGDIRFKFREDASPFTLCPQVVSTLQKMPPSEALCGDYMLYEYDPDAIVSLLSKLSLGSVRVQVQAKKLADRCTMTDTSYGSPMQLLPIEPKWLEAWSDAMNASGTAEASKKITTELGLSLPKPNPFIPEDLSLKPQPQEPQALPVLLKGTEPMMCVFHKQDDTFKQPKARVSFSIYSPFFTQDPANYTKTELWCRCVEEALQEYAYDAEVAGVEYSLGIGSACLRLVLAGYNDKLHVLLDAVTEKMVSMVEVPEQIFSIVASGMGDDLRNQAFHSPPYVQSNLRLDELTMRGTSFPAYQRLEAFDKITCADLKGLVEQFFAGGAHVESLMLGNLTADDARLLSSKLMAGLNLRKALPVLPTRAEACLPDGATLWELDSTDAEDPNHAVFLKIQMQSGLENEMLTFLLDKAISSKFFDLLRTQQQLGYIVHLVASVPVMAPYLLAFIQTEFNPNYVRGCMEKFLDKHFSFVEETMTDEEFETCKAGLLSELRLKPKNIAEEAKRFSRVFTDRTFDFDRRARSIRFVEASTLEMLRSFVRDQVRKAPRIYSQVKKLLDKEDKPLPSDAEIPGKENFRPGGFQTF